MYEAQFGLKRPPFRATAGGADVFLGPQTARTIKAFKKGLATRDGVVTLSGPAGVGKTTLAGRALDALGGAQTRIRIGRMSLAHDEVLEFLLDAMQAGELPASTIKKIALWRTMLAARTQAGERLFIIVEDAARIGEDALAELEALSAADGGAGGGASLVLMGDETLKKSLNLPSLDRLNQRVRVRHTLNALEAAELTGYMKHCFRMAGGEFDLLFAEGSGALLCEFSNGIPRFVNNLVDSILAAAAERGLEKIDHALIREIANEEYGLSVEVRALSPDAVAAPEPLAEAKPEPEPVAAAPEPEIAPPPPKADAVAPSPEPEPVAEPAPEPVAEPAVAEASDDDIDIPELIQDTLPDLEVLAPDLAAQAISDAEVDDESIPTLYTSMRIEVESGVSGGDAPPAPPAEPETIAEAPPPTLTIEPEPAAPPPVQEAPPPTLAIEPEPEPEPAAPAVEEPPTFAVEPEPATPAVEEAPLPTLSVEPEPAPIAAAPTPVEASQPAVEAESDGYVDKASETISEKPDWDRDPTLAQLRPDIAALEEALADIGEPEPAAAEAEEAPPPEVKVSLKDPTLPGVPQITLDDAIQDKIDEATAELEKHVATMAETSPVDGAPTLDLGGDAGEAASAQSARDTKADKELEQIAAGLAKARTIDDIDDKMAETLFGEEFSMIAAQVVANAPSADVEEPATPEPAELAQANGAAAASEPSEAPEVEDDLTAMEREFKEVYGEDALEVSMEAKPPAGGMESASQRLATVRALNAGNPAAPPPAENITLGNDADARHAGPKPEPIEDQIDTSLTQTIKTLKVKIEDVPEAKEEESKGGFFSRFRRS